MGRSNSRGVIRTVLVFIILGSLMCYALAIVVWLASPDANAPTATPTNDPTATWTPIDPNNIITNTPRTGVPTFTPIVLSPSPQTFVPVLPTNTRFITNTPSLPSPTPITPTVTNTPTAIVPPTATETQPILLPPSDTPSP